MKIKVCGLRRPGQFIEIAASGADYAGIIFHPASKRFIGDPGKEEKKFIKATAIKKIGVFVNHDPDQVKQAIETYDLYAVQLHGEESPAYCSQLQQHVTVIKVFGVEESSDIDSMIDPYMDYADLFLFDTAVHGKAGGGTGKKFTWNSLLSSKINKPFFLSGGIGPEDFDAIKAFIHPDFYGIDINSRFEIAPGEKDILMIKNFIERIKEIS